MTRRGVALVALVAAAAGCDRPRATPAPERAAATSASPSPSPPASTELMAPHPAWVPTPDERALVDCKLGALQKAKSHPGFFEGSCGDAAVLVLPATIAQPQRFRPQVALYRLSRRAAFDVVPVTAVRVDPVVTFLERIDRADASVLAVDPGGRVTSAITRLPPGKPVATKYSNEGAQWARWAAAATPPTGTDAVTLDDWLRITALDYMTGNLFRGTVWATADGHLLVTDARTAFMEHPTPDAVDQILDRLKKSKRAPRGLSDGLAAVTPTTLDADLRAGSYEEWLVPHRALGEVHQRTLAARGWALAVNADPPPAR